MVDMVALPPANPAAKFGDLVWVDANGNGIQNDGEAGLPGAKVNLLTCSGNVIDSTVTDANGRYSFDQLRSGQYKLHFPAPTG